MILEVEAPSMKYIFILISCLLATSLYAQQSSFAEMTSGFRYDSSQVKGWLKRSEKFSTLQTDSALMYAEKALFASSQMGNQDLVIKSLNAKGVAYEFGGRYKEAVENFKSAAVLAQQIKDTFALSGALSMMAYPLLELDHSEEAIATVKQASILADKLANLQLQGKANNTIALIYYRLGAGELFVQYLLKALTACEKMGDARKIGAINNNLGIYYYDKQNIAEAQKRYLLAEKVGREIDDTQIVANATMNLGNLFRDKEEFEKAEAYFKESIAAFQELHDVRGYADCIINYAELMRKQKKWAEALSYTDEADSLYSYGGSQFGMLHAIGNRAEIYLDQQKFEDAILTSHLGYDQLANKGFPPVEGKFADQLSRIYEAMHKTDSAFKYYKIATAIKDSIQILTDKDKIQADALMRKDVELNILASQNEQKEKIITRKNVAIWLMGGLLLIILVVLGFVGQLRIRDRIYQENLLKQRGEIEIQQQELIRLNKFKDHFISVLSHDMRSPLNSLKYSIELIEENSVSSPMVAKWLPGIEKELHRTVWLLNDLLEWGKVHMEESIMLTPISLVPVVRENIDLIIPMAEHKDISLVFDQYIDLHVLADAQSFGLVIRNLLSNAVKFTRTGGKVEVRCSKKDNYLKIDVADNGVGLSPNALKSWKENKHHSSMGTNREKGSGIGLTLCRDMVAKMNGHMEVASKSNEGTTFSVYLPLAR